MKQSEKVAPNITSNYTTNVNEAFNEVLRESDQFSLAPKKWKKQKTKLPQLPENILTCFL